MNTRVRMLVFVASAALAFGAARPAEAQHGLLHHLIHYHGEASVDPLARGRGGRPMRRIYPPEYDGIRAYYGGRGDNGWRRNPDEGNPRYLGPPVIAPAIPIW